MTLPHPRAWRSWLATLALCLLWQPATSMAGAPAAQVKQLQAKIKQTKKVAAYVKLSLQLGHLHRKHKAYAAAIAAYDRLGKKYKKPEVQCVVAHFAAQSLLAQGKTGAALGRYGAMRKQFRGCACRYLPNAYIAMGRAAFDKKAYAKALSHYKRAPSCRKNKIGAVAAAYMAGWCSYKLKRYKPSLRAMRKALTEMRKLQRRRGPHQQKLKTIQREALPNLVRAFNRAGSPANALRTFGRVADKAQVVKMVKQLASSYHTTKSYKKLRALFQKMARAYRGKPQEVRAHLEVLQAAYRLKDDRGLMRTLPKVVRTTRKQRAAMGSTATLKKDLAAVQDQLHRFAMGKHREAQKADSKKLYKQSETFFTAYRKLFPQAKDAHKKAYWHGEAAIALEKFARAADAYTASAQDKRSFKHKEDAAYKAALARHRLLNNKKALKYAKPTPKKGAKPKKLPKKFQLFLAAGSFYRTKHPTGKKVPYVLYNMGLVYQRFQHWDKARNAFGSLVKKHPRTRYARPAAYHVVDTLRIRQQWGLLHKWTTTFATLPSFGSRLFKKQMRAMGRAAQTKQCFELDTAKQYVKAGQCYQRMAKALGKHKDTPVLLYNAHVAFHNGKQTQQAAAMKKALLRDYPRSRPAGMLKGK